MKFGVQRRYTCGWDWAYGEEANSVFATLEEAKHEVSRRGGRHAARLGRGIKRADLRVVVEYRGRWFDAVELFTVVEVTGRDGEAYHEVIHSQEDYLHHRDVIGNLRRVMFSVYGHLVEGGISCIADCDTQENAKLVGDALAKAWGVEVNDYSIAVED